MAVVVLLLSMLGASPAWAHATLIDTTPGDTTVLGAAPTQVTLRYDEAVGTELGAVRVLAPDGSRVDAGEVTASADGREITTALGADLPEGTYTVLWRVLSEDSHSIFGASTFSVGRPSATAAAQAQADQAGAGSAAEDVLAVARLLLYVGLALLIGALGFLVVLWPAGSAVVGMRRTVWAGWSLTVGASVAGLLAQGPYGAGLPLTSAWDPTLILDVVGTRYGVATVIRLLLAGVLALSMGGVLRAVAARRPTGIVLGTVLSVGVLATTSMVGHSGSGPLGGVALPLDVIHLAAMAGWLGGLAVLAGVLLRRPDDLREVLPRWSRYAAGCVVVLVTSGVFAAWREVREWGALTGTEYGRLLIVKAVLVVVLLLAAGVARLLLRRRVLRPIVSSVPATASPPVADDAEVVARDVRGGAASAGPSGSRAGTVTAVRPSPPPEDGTMRGLSRLRWNVVVESALAVVVLAVTALLVSTPPARETYAPTATQVSPVTGPLQVRMELDPARAGASTLRLIYTRNGLTPTDAVRVTARFTLAGGGDGQDEVVPVELTRVGVGRYQVDRVLLPTAGTWQLAVATQTSDIDSSTTLFSIDVR